MKRFKNLDLSKLSTCRAKARHDDSRPTDRWGPNPDPVWLTLTSALARHFLLFSA